jgi:hypothetical protein
LIFEPCFNQDILQNYTNLSLSFKFIKHLFLDAGIAHEHVLDVMVILVLVFFYIRHALAAPF